MENATVYIWNQNRWHDDGLPADSKREFLSLHHAEKWLKKEGWWLNNDGDHYSKAVTPPGVWVQLGRADIKQRTAL